MKISCLHALVLIHLIGLHFAKETLLVVSIATDETDGFKRFIRSLQNYNYSYEVYGLGEKWNGGNMKLSQGGGQKVNMLIRELEKYKNDNEKIILFTDSYDVIFTQESDYVLEKFKKFNSRIVFSAESTCWPDSSLKDEYPKVSSTKESRFLNSGGIIGYLSDFYEIISNANLKDDDDDQLFYTKIYLDPILREKYSIKLDTKSNIFQNLNGAVNDISIISKNGLNIIYNNITQTTPAIIHANGPTKLELNRLGNYIGKAYSDQDGCIICHENTISLNDIFGDEWPHVTVGIFIDEPTPFLREFFAKFSKLNYPKSKMTILLYNNVNSYDDLIMDNFFFDSSNQYYSLKYLTAEEDSPEYEAKSEAISDCIRNNCEYYFYVSSIAHIDNPDTLKLLIEQNRPILAPIILRPETVWSNVWGAISSDGYYARSIDYFDIIQNKKIGVWNLPFISAIYLIQGNILDKIVSAYEHSEFQSYRAFTETLRNKDIFMYGTNMENFGHLINPDNYNISLIRPEMFEIMHNIKDWTERYINNEYFDFISSKKFPLEPCKDVFWAPILNDEACEDIIIIMEDYGKWSGGNDNTSDPRLAGGYENVPTVDIHFTQINFQKHWLYFLKRFVQPIQTKIFPGYYSEIPRSDLNFVVRYRPGEQDHLRPHNDASKYTINIALNKPNIDFQGGGCRFVRQNCTVTQTRKGWLFLHPGRVTHYHEGLKVTGGTRYILVSFVDN